MHDPTLIPAPGAKAAKVCGILAIVFALTCVGIPVAVVLGIVALVQHAKAQRLAKADPQRYVPVPATGLVTGIIGLVLPLLMLPVMGIVSAIAIPALLAQRGRARERTLQVEFQAVRQRAAALVAEAQARTAAGPVDGEAVIRQLLADPALAALKSPYDLQRPLLQEGPGGPGVISLSVEEEAADGVVTEVLRLRAEVPPPPKAHELEEEVVLGTRQAGPVPPSPGDPGALHP